MNVEKLKRRWLLEDELKIDSAIAAAVGTREGRKLLWWLLTIGRVGTQPFSTNALNTAFACGELNVGQMILDRIISVSPEGYLSMMQENNDEHKERDALLNMDHQADDARADDRPADERS